MLSIKRRAGFVKYTASTKLLMCVGLHYSGTIQPSALLWGEFRIP